MSAPEPTYTVNPARYAKGMLLVRAASADGYKTRVARLLDALKCRWTNRERGYVVSPSKLRRLERLLADGWDANFFTNALTPPGA